MLIKTLQWNIGGGYIRNQNDSVEPENFSINDIGHIGNILKQYSPDIVCLQETHADESISQVKTLGNLLGYQYFTNDSCAISHLDQTKKLCQSIISRFPIKKHDFDLFINPRFEVIRPNGEKWISHDKGVVTVILELPDGLSLELKNLHLTPFRKFKVNPFSDSVRPLREDIAAKILPKEESFILQGDFNYDDSSLVEFLPELFKNGVTEVVLDKPTTPRGRRYDHVVYSGLKHVRSIVDDSALTDHFPIYSEFNLN